MSQTHEQDVPPSSIFEEEGSMPSPDDIKAAIALQREMAPRVIRQTDMDEVRLVAGIDISANDRTGVARAAVVVLRYPELEVIETQVHEEPLRFPYVPGLLSFREVPSILVAYAALQHQPDLLIVDGQGIAHPRRLGIAAHLGVLLDRPTVGCAKSRLCGTYGPVGEEAGARTPLVHRGEVIGMVVRSKPRTNPLFISIGHRVDLPTAVDYTLACCRGYRLPEPTRRAHLAAGSR